MTSVNVHFKSGDRVEAVAKTVHVSDGSDCYLLSLLIGGTEIRLFADDFAVYSELIARIDTAARAHSVEIEEASRG